MSLQALHPITIHFPIVLPFLMVTLTALGLIKNGTKFPHLAIFNLLTSLLLFVSSGLAYWTGQRDSFGSAADPDAIAHHELAAKYFLALSALAVLLFAWAHIKKPQGRLFNILLFLISLGLVALTIWTGHLGGALVYQ